MWHWQRFRLLNFPRRWSRGRSRWQGLAWSFRRCSGRVGCWRRRQLTWSSADWSRFEPAGRCKRASDRTRCCSGPCCTGWCCRRRCRRRLSLIRRQLSDVASNPVGGYSMMDLVLSGLELENIWKSKKCSCDQNSALGLKRGWALSFQFLVLTILTKEKVKTQSYSDRICSITFVNKLYIL